jgi:hypothetical protein
VFLVDLFVFVSVGIRDFVFAKVQMGMVTARTLWREDPTALVCRGRASSPIISVGTTRQGVQVTVIPSKHSALFNPVLPVWPSSQSVMFVPVAVTIPLKFVQVEPLQVAAGVRLVAVDQVVEAVGLTLTVHVA